MTEIRIKSPDGGAQHPHHQPFSTSIQLQGLVADNPGAAIGLSGSRGAGGTGSLPEKRLRDSLTDVDRRERVCSRVSMPASLKSEPDLDTIMPLPGSGVLSRTAAGGYDGGGEEEECHSEGSEENGEDHISPSFTTVEVSLQPV